MPLRMSVRPTANHTRTPLGTGITAAPAPRRPRPPKPETPKLGSGRGRGLQIRPRSPAWAAVRRGHRQPAPPAPEQSHLAPGLGALILASCRTSCRTARAPAVLAHQGRGAIYGFLVFVPRGYEAGDYARLNPAGLKLGLGEWLIGAKCGERGEPIDAPPAFLPAARVDCPGPPFGRAFRPPRRAPRPRGLLSVRRLCRSARRWAPWPLRARTLWRARGRLRNLLSGVGAAGAGQRLDGAHLQHALPHDADDGPDRRCHGYAVRRA